MKNLSIMLKPASSACNLRCSYCFYRDVSESRETQSFGKMSLSLMHRVLDNVFCDLTAGDQVNIAHLDFDNYPMDCSLTIYKHEKGKEDVPLSRARFRIRYADQTAFFWTKNGAAF